MAIHGVKERLVSNCYTKLNWRWVSIFPFQVEMGFKFTFRVYNPCFFCFLTSCRRYVEGTPGTALLEAVRGGQTAAAATLIQAGAGLDAVDPFTARGIGAS